MKKTYYTYKKSGVNITSADRLVNFIGKISKKTIDNSNNAKHFRNIGSFGSVYDLSKKKLSSPLIVSTTDGVGTKLEIANELKNFKNIGIDLVAMCVNDLIVQGAKPLFFLDYIAIAKLDIKKIKKIISSIVKGCKIAECELAGGETAEMPGTYGKNKFDLAGFSVGVVEKKKLIIKNNVKNGNVILAIPSSGVHANGFSLIRKIISQKKISLKRKFSFSSSLGKELLKPTKIYTNEICKLNNKGLINASAHITGGGLQSNIERVIPNQYQINIDLGKIKILNIFKWLKKQNISTKEMLRTFNCGIGFCLIVDKKNTRIIKKFFKKKYKPYEIGYISFKSFKKKMYGQIKW